jgi:PadR family transcriptional regulator PadR
MASFPQSKRTDFSVAPSHSRRAPRDRIALDNNLYIYRLDLVKTPRLSPQTLCVLERFIEHPTAWRYGYELSRETGLKSGTLYPILMRLAKFSLLETKWVTTEDGVPPRHTYRLTPNGIELVRETLATATRSTLRARRPAFSGGRA